MTGSERPSVLNDIETLSLEVSRAKPVALTLVALEAYAQSVEMPEAQIERHADAIREMEPALLKRLRKALNAAAELSELLELAIIPEAEVAASITQEFEEPTVAPLERPPEVVEPGEVLAEPLEAPEVDVSDVSDTESNEKSERPDELSEKGLA